MNTPDVLQSTTLAELVALVARAAERGSELAARAEKAAAILLSGKVADPVARLPEAERTDLYDAIGAGIHDARMAAEWLTESGPQTQNVAQFLTYLSLGIRELKAARGVVLRHAT